MALEYPHIWLLIAPTSAYSTTSAYYLYRTRQRGREAQRRLGGALIRLAPDELPRVDTGNTTEKAPDFREFSLNAFVNQ